MSNALQSRRRGRVRVFGPRVAGTILVALFILPFLIAISGALRSPEAVDRSPLGLPTSLDFANISQVYSAIDYGRSLLNTVVITAGTCAIVVLLGSMAGYALALTTRAWSAWVYRLFILGMTVPVFVFIAPLYLEMRNLNLLGSTFGVILIYASLNLPISVFFYTSFVRTIPGVLREAAAIDGAGQIRIFLRIYLPLLGPVTATLLLFVTMTVWNDLMIPLIFLQNPEQQTVMVNAYSLLDTKNVQPTEMFAATLIGTAPLVLLFAFFQRRMVEGLSGGAVKG